VDEEVRAVRVRVEDQRPVGGVMPRGIVLPALVAIVVPVASLVSGVRARRERDRSREESDDSPV
jgi:hypothetical protein